jgi:multiple sugar transport system ATP-binding protein
MKKINKIYPGNVHAVSDFNIDVEKGDFIVLVGPSGCGKSTVLRMIAGLEEISSGDMLLDEMRINDLAPSDREVAVVFQDYALYGNMTVYENIGFSLTLKGSPLEEIHERVIDVSKTVELYDYLNRFPKALSGGQRQRVAMGRSLAKHAKILLMDEPLSNLDAKLRQQTRKELAILHNELQPTIIYVTHDQTEAMTLANRIVVMKDGFIQQIGSPYEIYHFPENIFTASFIGTPPINLVKGCIENGIFTALNEKQDSSFRCKIPQEIAKTCKTKSIVMGLRPESIRPVQQGEKTSDDLCVFSAPVSSYEFLGSEYYASLNHEGCFLTCRIPAGEEVYTGKNLDAAFDIHKAHFFDEETGFRLKGDLYE